MSESQNAAIAKKILYSQHDSSNQVRNKALSMIYEQRKTINNKQAYFPNSSYDDTPENNLLARVVEYCLKNAEKAEFKDTNSIATIVKKNINNTTLSVYDSVVIYNYLSDFIIQYTKNNDRNPAIINTTKIFIGKNGNVSGDSTDYTLVKKPIVIENKTSYFFEEEVLSKCNIDDMDKSKQENKTPMENILYNQMEICSSLLKPVMKKLGIIGIEEDENKSTTRKENQNRSFNELNAMINNQGTKNADNKVRKSI